MSIVIIDRWPPTYARVPSAAIATLSGESPNGTTLVRASHETSSVEVVVPATFCALSTYDDAGACEGRGTTIEPDAGNSEVQPEIVHCTSRPLTDHAISTSASGVKLARTVPVNVS